MKTDVIDVIQLHGIGSEPEVRDERARTALSRAMKEGKVRFPGVTTHNGQEAVLRAVMEHGFYRTVLAGYNFRSGEPLSRTIGEASKKGIGVIAMKTQAGGYSFPGGKATPHQAALAWVLSNRGVATTIPGMTSFAQVDENLKACGMRLSFGGRKSLAAYGEAIADRHCGMCGACRAGSCPAGVDVPSVARALMYLEGYGNPPLARETYAGLAGNAAACASCEGCVVACRLGLPVARLGRRAHEALA